MVKKLASANNGFRRTHESLVVQAIRETFDPLVKALDARPALLMADSADTGHSAPSSQDMGLKILLGQIMQATWRQAYGVLTSKSGSISNYEQRFQAAERNLTDLEEQVRENKIDIVSPAAAKVFHNYEVAEARCSTAADFLSSLAVYYRETFGEDWKSYQPSAEQAEVSSTKKVILTKEENDRMVQLAEEQFAKIRRKTETDRLIPKNVEVASNSLVA
jgi:hypothetical protein